jgi:hypothetical protein
VFSSLPDDLALEAHGDSDRVTTRRRTINSTVGPCMHPFTILALMLSGFLLCSYTQSLLAVSAASGFVFLLGIGLMVTFGRGLMGAFVSTFAVCLLAAGISAIYSNVLGDQNQQSLDAYYFFEMATRHRSTHFFDIFQYENGGAIALWQIFYIFFDWLGIPTTMHIGIMVNCLLVSLACVVGMKIVAAVFENDYYRQRLFLSRFSACSLFWLFAAVHVRDAVVLLSVSLLFLHWVRFLKRGSLIGLVWLLALSAFWAFALGALRREYFNLPISFFGAGLLAWLCSYRKSPRGFKLISLSLIISAIIVIGASTPWLFSIFSDFDSGRETYLSLTRAESSSSSLGASILEEGGIITQLLIRTAYLYVFPIPVWSGFQTESVYHLFKSLHAIFMYFLIPVFLVSLQRLLFRPSLRRVDLLFLGFCSVVFSVAIAYSSVETRHLGPFLTPMIVLSLAPDLRNRNDRAAIRLTVQLYLFGVFCIHCAWAALKYAL